MMYGSTTLADAYFSTRLYTKAWDNTTTDKKTRALTMATQAIDHLNFFGAKTDPTQAQEFPRGGDTTIPDDILKATYELALELIKGADPEREIANSAIKSNAFEGVRTTYDRTVTAEHIVAGISSITAWRLLQPYLRANSVIQLSRVT